MLWTGIFNAPCFEQGYSRYLALNRYSKDTVLWTGMMKAPCFEQGYSRHRALNRDIQGTVIWTGIVKTPCFEQGCWRHRALNRELQSVMQSRRDTFQLYITTHGLLQHHLKHRKIDYGIYFLSGRLQQWSRLHVIVIDLKLFSHDPDCSIVLHNVTVWSY